MFRPTRIGLGVAKTPDRRQLSRSPSTSLLELPRVSFWCFTNSLRLRALKKPIHPVGASSFKRLCAVRVRDLPTRLSCPILPLFRPPLSPHRLHHIGQDESVSRNPAESLKLVSHTESRRTEADLAINIRKATSIGKSEEIEERSNRELDALTN